MNSFKLFVAVMLAVAVMQVYASQQRSEEQNKLHDAIYEFQEDIKSNSSWWEDIAINRFLVCYMNLDMDTFVCSCKPEYTRDFSKTIKQLEIKLSHTIMHHDQLVDMASEFKGMLAPPDYQKTQQYKNVAKICDDIID